MGSRVAPASTIASTFAAGTWQPGVAAASGAAPEAASADPACAQEPIHIPGTIQPHGAMLVVDPLCDWTVIAASRNTIGMLHASASADRVIGRSVGSILGLHFGEAVQMRF